MYYTLKNNNTLGIPKIGSPLRHDTTSFYTYTSQMNFIIGYLALTSGILCGTISEEEKQSCNQVAGVVAEGGTVICLGFGIVVPDN